MSYSQPSHYGTLRIGFAECEHIKCSPALLRSFAYLAWPSQRQPEAGRPPSAAFGGLMAALITTRVPTTGLQCVIRHEICRCFDCGETSAKVSLQRTLPMPRPYLPAHPCTPRCLRHSAPLACQLTVRMSGYAALLLVEHDGMLSESETQSTAWSYPTSSFTSKKAACALHRRKPVSQRLNCNFQATLKLKSTDFHTRCLAKTAKPASSGMAQPLARTPPSTTRTPTLLVIPKMLPSLS